MSGIGSEAEYAYCTALEMFVEGPASSDEPEVA